MRSYTNQTITALGLMSGTSLDGIDGAILRTDGETLVEPGAALTRPYDKPLRDLLGQATHEAQGLSRDEPWSDVVNQAAREVTLAHAKLVADLMESAGLANEDVDLIGFHGQTLIHRPGWLVGPDQAFTLQIGDGALLAQLSGVDVVNDFRSADMASGGEGGPLAPLYHEVLASKLERGGPVAVVNIGGVANVTFVPAGGDEAGQKLLLAFDAGPGNGLIDDWIAAHTDASYDKGGGLAATGTVHQNVLLSMLDHPFFEQRPPKSLDRGDFSAQPVRGLSVADGAATLTAFTAACIGLARHQLPAEPEMWIVCGGGRHNDALISDLRKALPTEVVKAEKVGWQGDFIEAQAFAYLAVRSRLGLPLSVPGTTGVPEPLTGGAFHRASRA